MGRTNWNPGNGGCTDSWLREAGTGGGRSFGGGARGEGGAEHGTCLFFGGRTPAGRGRCGPGGPDAAGG